MPDRGPVRPGGCAAGAPRAGTQLHSPLGARSAANPRAPPKPLSPPSATVSVRALSYSDTVNSERVHGTGAVQSELDIDQLDAPLIAAFLNHLEKHRGNSVRTRNHRLAAIHSLFAYMALHHPEHAASIQRVLAIPHKRTERNLVTYLTEPEVDALLAACDQTTWTGRRDHALFVLTIQAGLRISELAALTCADITLSTGANVHVLGKGRKERRTPLVRDTRTVLKAWLKERSGAPTDPMFPTTTGEHLSRDAIERRLARHLAITAERCPSIKTKHVTMHTLRHTAAMRLLLAGNDVTVIALWLGHTSNSRRPTSTYTRT